MQTAVVRNVYTLLIELEMNVRRGHTRKGGMQIQMKSSNEQWSHFNYQQSLKLQL